MLPSPRLQKLHVDSLVVRHWIVVLKARPFVKQNKAEFTNVSLRFLCAAQTLHCLAGYFLFPSPPPTIFSSLCILKSPDSLPGGSCLGPLGVVCFSGNWRSSELHSLQFWTSDIQDLPTLCRSSCTLLFCLYLVSCTKKMHWREHSLADTVPLFSTILQFSSELSNNWGTCLPCPRPSWIYCTGQQQKASLLPCLFSCLSALCLQLLPHGSYLSLAQVFCPSTIAPLRHLFSRTLTALFQVPAFPF